MKVKRISKCPFTIVPQFSTNKATVIVANRGIDTTKSLNLKFIKWLWIAFCYSNSNNILKDILKGSK